MRRRHRCPRSAARADAESYWLAATWRAATPGQVGVDGAAISDLIARLRSGSLGAEHGIVIVRKDYVIVGWTSSYGYPWWLYTLTGGQPDANTRDIVIAASGAQGQWLFVVPQYDLVVAINAGITAGPDPALDMMFGTILPAMR